MYNRVFTISGSVASMVCCSSSAHIAPPVAFRACRCNDLDKVRDRITDFSCVFVSYFCVLKFSWSLISSFCAIPCSLFVTRLEEVGSQFLVLSSWFLVLGSWFSVLGSWFLVLSSWFSVPGSWFLVPGSWFLVPGSQPAHDAVEHATPGTIAHRAHGTSKCAC